MVLNQNYGALFFLFFWGTVFSQGKQFKRTNENFKDGGFIDVIWEFDKEKKTLKSVKNLEEQRSIDKRAKQLVDKFVVNKLSINSKYSDYAPSFFNGELVFASSRNTNNFLNIVDESNNQPFLDLYSISIANISNKNDVLRLKGNINTKFHESSATFSKDGETVYFTRNNYSKNKSITSINGVVLLKIYKASYINGKWDDIEELPFNSDEYSIAHPALSPDGKFLYFASDMPGSIGKSDLYVVEINRDGSFGEPRNLGSQINTSGRETFPYVSDQGKLFFASDGHKGLGGLDVFMVMPYQDDFFEVYNLGKPINSSKDDFTFIIDEKSRTGYFASNRRGGKGDDDIYSFKQIDSFPNHYELRGVQKLERILELKPSKEATTSL
ncbi:TolB family protein [Aquimarina muelleri]|uniref:WD40-like Beta Propeller Repeat n=1 Tax=Aquimarina muelleri TaxID=279356 RepID=A0A918JTD7_9FLAO|nr:PD40 domain-containing protein [Aquimarina muelleri]MCX2761283.1 PD40 domain-containing protein [Aquimarina muelleri]GGX09622.1 hypothetical protein GCM10007384_09350 [Aquimarina muelleri]